KSGGAARRRRRRAGGSGQDEVDRADRRRAGRLRRTGIGAQHAALGGRGAAAAAGGSRRRRRAADYRRTRKLRQIERRGGKGPRGMEEGQRRQMKKLLLIPLMATSAFAEVE